MGGHFVLTLKNHGTVREIAKVRNIAQVCNDRDMLEILHDTATVIHSSIRLILSIKALNGVQLFSHDVAQAYLLSKDKLAPPVYLRVKKEDRGTFGVREDELFELIKLL